MYFLVLGFISGYCCLDWCSLVQMWSFSYYNLVCVYYGGGYCLVYC